MFPFKVCCGWFWFRFRWFKNLLYGGSVHCIAFNFLGAGVRVGGARISLHLLHCHSDQNFTLLPLCRSDQIVHSLTLTNSIHCGSGGMGEWRSYILLRVTPWLIVGWGEGWNRSRPIEKSTLFFRLRFYTIYSRKYPWYFLPKWIKSEV